MERGPKVVAYARVSTDKQDAENQRFEIDNYLARQGKSIDEYVEETISGTRDIRERKLGSIIEELAAKDTLIVSETSRISRRLSEIFSTIQYLIDKGIILIAVKQNFVFADDINSKVIAFAFGLAAEIERDLISSRTKEALARMKSEGKTLGRPVGTGDPKRRKLYGKDEEILTYMEKRVPKAVMARLLDVNRGTLQTYIDEQNLVFELRTRQLRRAMQRDGTWREKQPQQSRAA